MANLYAIFPYFLALALSVLSLNASGQSTPVTSAKEEPMKEFFGINENLIQGYNNAEDLAPVVGWIRDYTHWRYYEPANNDYNFTHIQDTFNQDAIYQQLKDLGIKPLPVVMEAPVWISTHPESERATRYAPSGDQDGSSPEHYREAAEFFYQYAARYGSQQLPDDKLRTPDKKSGLNLIPVVEVFNEADGDTSWGNFITRKQYASLLNAVYDGNQGKMGDGYGIKAADPDLPVSITGLGFNLEALKEITRYAGRAPYDIINVHFYTFRYARENYRVSVPPEWSSLVEDMQEIIEWGKVHAPGRPVWLTEIGWDTKPYNPEAVTEQEAANYLIRTFLLTKGAGVDKCFWFYNRDLDNQPRKGVFATSGLFENITVPSQGVTQLKPKLTYWYFGTMTHLIGDLYYKENHSQQQDSTVYHYTFQSADEKKEVSVVWYCPPYVYKWRQLVEHPASQSYTIPIPEGATSVRIVRPTGGTFQGESQPVLRDQGTLTLQATATPQFIEIIY